ncbi:MAG: hypothetical protein AAF226_00145 [Verrucomicrobiota bacterium]
MIRPVFFVLLLVTLGLSSFAKEPITPNPGSSLRKEILNAIRDPFEDHIHQEVVFVVQHLKVQDDWAFLMAEARTKEGAKIDYSGTSLEFGTTEFDEGVIAVLRFKRDRWYVVQSSFFASDVWWAGAHEELKAPKAIFPLGTGED